MTTEPRYDRHAPPGSELRDTQDRLRRERALRACFEASTDLTVQVTHALMTEVGFPPLIAQLIAETAQSLPEELSEARANLLEVAEDLGRFVIRSAPRIRGLVYLTNVRHERERAHLDELVSDYITLFENAMGPDLEMNRLRVELSVTEGDYPWEGGPSFIQHVIVGLLQLSLTASYKSRAADDTMNVELMPNDVTEGYRLRFSLDGPLSRIFEQALEPGPGFAMLPTVVTELLGGDLELEHYGETGAALTILLPLVSPGLDLEGDEAT